MFLDTEGEDSSGVRIYAVKEVFIGREVEFTENRNDAGYLIPKATEVPEDRNKNKNIEDFGKVESDLPWYIDTTTIDSSKLSRIITAYKYGILVETDPENKPDFAKTENKLVREFDVDKHGERIFTGKNKEMFKRLQNMNFKDLRDFISNFPKNDKAKENLMDLYTYELRGYNSLNRPRVEVIKLLKSKLQDYGPGISAIRINED
jgi:hypothetical protein